MGFTARGGTIGRSNCGSAMLEGLVLRSPGALWGARLPIASGAM